MDPRENNNAERGRTDSGPNRSNNASASPSRESSGNSFSGFNLPQMTNPPMMHQITPPHMANQMMPQLLPQQMAVHQLMSQQIPQMYPQQQMPLANHTMSPQQISPHQQMPLATHMMSPQQMFLQQQMPFPPFFNTLQAMATAFMGTSAPNTTQVGSPQTQAQIGMTTYGTGNSKQMGSSLPGPGDGNVNSVNKWLQQPSLCCDSEVGGPSEENQTSTPTKANKRSRTDMRVAIANFFAKHRTENLAMRNADTRHGMLRSAVKPAIVDLSDSDDYVAPPKSAANEKRVSRPQQQPKKKMPHSKFLQKGVLTKKGTSVAADQPVSKLPWDKKGKLVCRLCRKRKPNAMLKCYHAFCLKCIKNLHSKTKQRPRCPTNCPFRSWELLFY